MCFCTIAECAGLESILHRRVLPGTTQTVSWTSGMSSASSFSAPSTSSCNKTTDCNCCYSENTQSKYSEPTFLILENDLVYTVSTYIYHITISVTICLTSVKLSPNKAGKLHTLCSYYVSLQTAKQSNAE